MPAEATEGETSFTQSIPADPTADEPPMWATETEPQENEATPFELDRRLAQFEAERVNFPQQNLEFRASKDGTLRVRWGSKWVVLTSGRDPTKVLATGTIKKYGGVQLVRALGLIPELGPKATAALQKAAEEIPVDSQLEYIPLRDLSTAAKEAEATVKELVAGTPELPLCELIGLDQALQRTRGGLVNNLAKLTALDDHIAMEQRKLGEAGDAE